VAYAQSGYCRWQLLSEHFGDKADAADAACGCDNCQSPPVLTERVSEAHAIDEVPPISLSMEAAPAPAAPPQIEVGSQVKVPRFDIGTVMSVAGDKVTIAFPENTTRTFMAEFVAPA